MVIERILSPVHSLGPGERICIWTKGCKKKCPGCISPEMQDGTGNEIDEHVLAELLSQIAKKTGCNGLTISGGDPFEQANSLLALLTNVRSTFEDILVYTGFEMAEIMDGTAGKDAKKCLGLIDVLIDGRYIRERNNPDCILRGSDNQVIHFFNEKLVPTYSEYMEKGRILESFVHGDTTIITGIMNEVTNE